MSWNLKRLGSKVSPRSSTPTSEPALPGVGNPEFSGPLGMPNPVPGPRKVTADVIFSLRNQPLAGNYQLIAAARKGELAEAEKFLNSYSDPNLQDKADYGARPLHYAAMQGRRLLYEGPTYTWNVAIKLVALLIKFHADVRLTDALGFTPLHLAASLGSAEIVKMLLAACPEKERKKYIDAQDKEIQRTALHHAAEKGHTDVVAVLLAAGATVGRLYDRTGFTAWQLAVHEDQAQLLFSQLLERMQAGRDGAIQPQPLMTLLIAMGADSTDVDHLVRVIKQSHPKPEEAAWDTMADAVAASKPEFVDMLLTSILKQMPAAVVKLTVKPWVETLLALATSFPDSVQHLIKQLETLDEKVLRSFVENLKLSTFLGGSDTMKDAYRNLFFKQLVLGLDGVQYPTLKIFLESLDDEFLREMAKFPSFFRQLPRFLAEHENVTADAKLNGWTMPTDELVLFNVRPLMLAAVKSRIPDNVEATVKSIMHWLESNTDCFITGIDAEIMEDFAGQFPIVATAMLDMEMLGDRVSKGEVVWVPAETLESGADEYRCSDTMLSYIWQQEEMSYLSSKGVPRRDVNQFVREGINVKVLVKAIRGGSSVKDIRGLARRGLSGREVSTLITYGADARKVVAAMDNGVTPETIGSMLRAKLVFQIVDIMLGEPIDYTTMYWNVRTNKVWKRFNKPSWEKGITYPFVINFLNAWHDSVAEKPNDEGVIERGFRNKSFIDSVFNFNDPLYSKLKTVFDFKGDDKSETIREKALSASFWNDEEFIHYTTVLRAFATPKWLFHRWTIAYTTMGLWMVWHVITHNINQWRARHNPKQRYQVGGRAVVVPIADTVVTGSKNLLKGLMDAGVESHWFGLPLVRAIILTEWNAYGRLFMLLSTVEHIVFMVLFGVFMLFYWPEDDSMTLPEVLMTHKFRVAIACEAVLAYMSLAGLVLELQQFRNLGYLWLTQPGNYLDAFSYLIIFAILICHLVRVDRSVLVAMAAIEVLILFLRLAFFAMMTDALGSLVRMVIEIIKDMRNFFFILIIIFGGFAAAFSMLLPKGTNNVNTTELYVHLFTMMAVGDIGSDFLTAILFPGLSDEDVNYENRQLTVILFSIYVILIVIVLINLLISLMGDTFGRIKASEEVEVLKNKAQIIVEIESFLPAYQLKRIHDNLLGRYLHILTPIKKSFGEHEDESGGWEERIMEIRESMRAELRKAFGNFQNGKPALHPDTPPAAGASTAVVAGTRPQPQPGSKPTPAAAAAPGSGKLVTSASDAEAKRAAMRAQDSFWAPDLGEEEEPSRGEAELSISRAGSGTMDMAMVGMAGEMMLEARVNGIEGQMQALAQQMTELLADSKRTQQALNKLLSQ